MDLITRAFTTGLLIWFALFALIIAGRVLRGNIKTNGLLRTQRHDENVAPERALSIMVFPLVIASYAYTALQTDVVATHSLPELSNGLLMLFTGSNGLYLAGKIARTQ